MEYIKHGLSFASLLAFVTIILKGVALYNTSKIEQLFLPMESNLLIRIMQYVTVATAFSYLITFCYWFFVDNHPIQIYIALFFVLIIFLLVFINSIMPLLSIFINKTSKYYVVENGQKLYILRTTYNKKILLSNNPSTKNKLDDTLYKIVEQEYILEKEIHEVNNKTNEVIKMSF
jgi:hypothetical protein